jgi:hypothetical protein
MILRASIPRCRAARLGRIEVIRMERAKVEFPLGCLFAASIALSTIHPLGNPRTSAQRGAPVLAATEVPERVRMALEAKCLGLPFAEHSLSALQPLSAAHVDD